MNKTLWAVVGGLLILLFADAANGQGTHEFLGSAREVPDRFTEKHGIRYNTQGFRRTRGELEEETSQVGK